MRIGVQHVIGRLLPARRINWRICEHARAEDIPGDINLAIGIGSLEWRGARFSDILHLAGRLACPWLLFAVEHQHADLRLAPVESAILSNAFIGVRTRAAHAVLTGAGFAGELLPCPSLFAARRENPSRRLRSVGVLSGYGATIDPAIFASVQELCKRYDVRMLCGESVHFFAFAERWPAATFFCPTVEAQMNHLMVCDAAVTADETCAFVANSLLKPALLIEGDGGRSLAAELFPYVLASPAGKVLGELCHLDMDTLPRDLLNWKRRVEDHYLATLSEWFRTHDVHLV